MSDYTDAVRTFFSSPSGEQLLTTITGMINSNHEKAENEPELALAYTQRAMGNREVLKLIQSSVALTPSKPVDSQ